jgi:rhodanese-related sulfurtransferase
MDSSQIILYVIIALVVFFIVRRIILVKSITHYSPTEASKKLKSGLNVILLDVRTAGERKNQNIKGSFHIPLPELSSRLNELNKFKGKEIICYCRTGNRSLSAAAKLKKLGFKTANLRGGVVQWSSAGLK